MVSYEEERDAFYREALRLRRKYYAAIKAFPLDAPIKALYNRANRLVVDIERELYEQR